MATHTIDNWLDGFRASIRPSCSPRYRQVVASMLGNWRDWLVEAGVCAASDVRRAHVSAWAERERGRVAPKTASNALVLVKRAVRWAVAEGWMAATMLEGWPVIRVPEKPRRVLSDDELDTLLNTCKRRAPELYPALLVSAYTGIRPIELCRLEAKHVDLEAGALRLPGTITKNGRSRVVALHDRVKEKLCQIRPPDGRVFPMARPTYSRKVREIAKVAGLEGVTAYTLRHTCATRLAAAGMSAWDLQRVLGHASVQTSQIYVNLADRKPPDMNILS